MKAYTFLRLGQSGRLGNQLWQVAATLDRALRENARPAIPPRWEYRPLLSLPDDAYAVVPGACEMEREPDGPYYQALRHIKHVDPRLREWFAPSELGMKRLDAAHARLLWLTEAQHTTAVHVRRGDYVEHADRFPPMTREYRQRAAKLVPAHTTFLIFSDDVPWCRAHLDEIGLDGQPVEFVAGAVNSNLSGPPSTTDDLLDLWLMSRCRAHIICNSSYSWWGAFLSEQEQVIYPDRWFADPALQDSMWDCIPDGWTQVPC